MKTSLYLKSIIITIMVFFYSTSCQKQEITPTPKTSDQGELSNDDEVLYQKTVESITRCGGSDTRDIGFLTPPIDDPTSLAWDWTSVGYSEVFNDASNLYIHIRSNAAAGWRLKSVRVYAGSTQRYFDLAETLGWGIIDHFKYSKYSTGCYNTCFFFCIPISRLGLDPAPNNTAAVAVSLQAVKVQKVSGVCKVLETQHSMHFDGNGGGIADNAIVYNPTFSDIRSCGGTTP
ncbi:hypothetical protein C3K47_18755 [Solitalea longa]|uniref:Uncharacterized protein n=1 Tax=Solitalea longa TaxID=2079460 RepID=A0A2S4ZWU5_9SPHI|nr:hypothetical protein [Solitalea longa]POY34775.1 hypothetical protein C3K47_18755 [Solitalea longa]